MNQWRAWALLWLVSLLVRVGVLGWIALSYADAGIGFAPPFKSGDTPQYLTPIEELLAHGRYQACPGGSNLQAAHPEEAWPYLGVPVGDPDCRAARLPGYGGVYLLLQLVMTPSLAEFGLVVIQILLAVTAAVVVSIVIVPGGGSYRWALALVLVAAPNLAVWDLYLLTESLSTSLLLLGASAAISALRQRKRASLVGLFWGVGLWTWAAFCRPVFLPLPFLLIAISFLYLPRSARLLASLAVLIPVLAWGGWVLRNAVVLGRPVILLSTYHGGPDEPPPGVAALLELTRQAGESLWRGAPYVEPPPRVTAEGFSARVAGWVGTDVLAALKETAALEADADTAITTRIQATRKLEQLADEASRGLPNGIAYRYIQSALRRQWRFFVQNPAQDTLPKGWRGAAGAGKMLLVVTLALYALALLSPLYGLWAGIRMIRAGKLPDAASMVCLLGFLYIATVYPWVVGGISARFLAPGLVLALCSGIAAKIHPQIKRVVIQGDKNS